MSVMSMMSAGKPFPMGATVTDSGVNFAVFSEHARRMTVCLFSEHGQETLRFDLPERDGYVWHGHIEGIGAGQRYGLRAHGLHDPRHGHRFNYNKLLIDPYARKFDGTLQWHDAIMGYTAGSPQSDLSLDLRDSAPYIPKCVVCEDPPKIDPEEKPGTSLRETIIYEAHVKGMTARHPLVPAKGTFSGLASKPVIDHLLNLGITAIELLPVHAFMDDRFLIEKQLRNYWGYQTLCFLAPEPRYLSDGDIGEFREMVRKFHEVGIEVILDVVYNHTCEGNETGPTLSFRGLDNLSYYRLQKNPRYYINDTGTGNTVNIEHPMVLRLAMDSLRYWVEIMGVDGFRFDLCSTLGRTSQGFDGNSGFFQAIRQDPLLSQVKLIAEPWDIGPGGYQLGAYPHPFCEWNDRFRDGIRRFWRGDEGMTPELANRLVGSADQFDHSGRHATSSVNFIAAHDGFTLADLTRYSRKHNLDNGEANRDGHDENFSDNMGVEGPSEEAEITASRARRRRNFMATLMLSQGTPMILAGDEIGNSQSGNNNAYCQDNETAWLDWAHSDTAFLSFTQKAIAFRKAHPILSQKLFLHSKERFIDGKEDLFWWRVDGEPMTYEDWVAPELDFLAAELRTASGTPRYHALEYAILLVFNGGTEKEYTLPECPRGQAWVCRLNTAKDEDPSDMALNGSLIVPKHSVLALTLEVASE